MKKWLVSLCMVLALIACKDEKKTEANAKPVIKIGVLYPMSGDGASLGEAAKNDVKMFFGEFNQQPHKYDYQIIFEDNQNQLSKQATLARKLINVDKVDVIITVMSNFGAVVSPMAEQNKVIHFSVATDPDVAKGFYNLITSSNPKGEAALLCKELVRNNLKNVDVVVMNATGSQTLFEYFKKEIEQEKSLSIRQVYTVNPDEKDFRLMLAKIKESKPNAIVSFLFMPTIDVFMKQYRDADMDSIPVTGIETFTYMQNKALANKLWYIDAAPATDDFIFKYLIRYDTKSTDYAEYMDFILQMITFGYEGAKTTDKTKVIEYIQNNSAGQETAVGKITTEPDGILNGQPVMKKMIHGQPFVEGKKNEKRVNVPSNKLKSKSASGSCGMQR